MNPALNEQQSWIHFILLTQLCQECFSHSAKLCECFLYHLFSLSSSAAPAQARMRLPLPRAELGWVLLFLTHQHPPQAQILG